MTATPTLRGSIIGLNNLSQLPSNSILNGANYGVGTVVPSPTQTDPEVKKLKEQVAELQRANQAAVQEFLILHKQFSDLRSELEHIKAFLAETQKSGQKQDYWR